MARLAHHGRVLCSVRGAPSQPILTSDPRHTWLAHRLSDATWQACERELPQLTPLDEGASSTTLLAGGICGTATWALAYPFDIIKTRAQVVPHPRQRWPPYCSVIPPAARSLAARCARTHCPYSAPFLACTAQTLPASLPAAERTMGAIARRLVAERGVAAGLYRGLGACLMRAFPVNAVTFLVYQRILSLLPTGTRTSGMPTVAPE